MSLSAVVAWVHTKSRGRLAPGYGRGLPCPRLTAESRCGDQDFARGIRYRSTWDVAPDGKRFLVELTQLAMQEPSESRQSPSGSTNCAAARRPGSKSGERLPTSEPESIPQS